MEILKKYNYNDIYNEEYNKAKKMLQNTIKLTFNFENISQMCYQGCIVVLLF